GQGLFGAQLDGIEGSAFSMKIADFGLAQNYDQGWPGTLGTPTITLAGDPLLCRTATLEASNSRGLTTVALAVLGLSKASVPTIYGGTLLVEPANILALGVPGAGLAVDLVVPCDELLLGLSCYAQLLEVDPGASRGVSF